MKITTVLSIIGAAACMLTPDCAKAQYSAADSVQNHVKGNRLSIGGYGEAAYTRNFYSDNVYRYTDPKSYKNDPSHGRFDIPHAVIYISYDFGKGWTMSSEIEFEHTGSGGAIEKEYSEGGEWEQEVEKGGEVELEQFWIQKSFGSFLNVRAGHIVVPVGLTNAHHEPLNYFTVYRPEGEATILPCTWHDTGISIWGRLGDFRYEVRDARRSGRVHVRQGKLDSRWRRLAFRIQGCKQIRLCCTYRQLYTTRTSCRFERILRTGHAQFVSPRV